MREHDMSFDFAEMVRTRPRRRSTRRENQKNICCREA